MGKQVQRNCAVEWSYTSSKSYDDPFNEVRLDVLITGPRGGVQRVPAFWSGGNTWRVRYASDRLGLHRCVTECSDTANANLHDQKGEIEVVPYEGANPLMARGPIQVSEDRRHFEHRDGTPFFWLGDTWWMGLCKRLSWPDGFQELTADRVSKGFSVIQIIAGLYPDMPPFDDRGANEAGFPWEPDFARINPAYFDQADLRIGHLVQAGLVPCIVGFWGFFYDFAGPERLKQHWRYLIARYGAYPVVWCVAGEGTMGYYSGPNFLKASEAWLAERRAAWVDVIQGVCAADPYRHPLTIHPSYPSSSRAQVADPTVLDFEMLQTGHWGDESVATSVDMLEAAIGQEPRMPTFVGEACYDGIMESNREEHQRALFWAAVLTGAAGHSYGANGIWQVNERGKPHGLSPHGMSWGNIPWDEAYRLPGSRQLGLGKRLLERFHWWEFEPHPEWVDARQTEVRALPPFAAGISGQVRVHFLPAASLLAYFFADGITLKDLERGIEYRAFLFDPKSGVEVPLGIATGDPQGEWAVPKPPVLQDWIVVLQR
jgi:hypothetical protein